MKNVFLSSLVLIIISSCAKLDRLTQFDMDYEAKTSIPSSFGINLPFDLPTPPITTNVETTYSVNDTRKDLIEEISLTSLIISTSGDNNFDFMKRMKIFINADGLDEIEVASKAIIGANLQTIEFDVFSEIDLKDYINKDEFILKVQPVTKKILFHDVDIKIGAIFHVDAKILGI